MLTTSIKWNVVLAAAILALAAVPGFASPIAVANFSFEELPFGGLPFSDCGANCVYSLDTIPGWTTTPFAVSGQFQPGTQAGNTVAFDSLSNGITSAFSNTTNSIISQIVVPTVQLGLTYTLQVDIGYRKGFTPTGKAALLIGSTTYLATGTLLSAGFSTFTATYVAQTADLGTPITIELLSGGSQANFDNVRLDGSLAPEPAPFLLIGSALLLLQALGRRRSNSKTKA